MESWLVPLMLCRLPADKFKTNLESMKQTIKQKQ